LAGSAAAIAHDPPQIGWQLGCDRPPVALDVTVCTGMGELH